MSVAGEGLRLSGRVYAGFDATRDSGARIASIDCMPCAMSLPRLNCRHKVSVVYRQNCRPVTVVRKQRAGNCERFLCKRFDEIDDGTIDLLSVDVEGSEWYVIKNLVSRPAVISVETHGALYSNPNLEKITGWMKNNDYIIWYKDRSDTVYVKKGMFNITIMDKIKYLAHEVYLKFRTYKKLLKKKSKK